MNVNKTPTDELVVSGGMGREVGRGGDRRAGGKGAERSTAVRREEKGRGNFAKRGSGIGVSEEAEMKM